MAAMAEYLPAESMVSNLLKIGFRLYLQNSG